MKKNMLVNVLIIFCMIMLCSCGTKTEETHTTDDPIEISSSDTEVTASYWKDFEKELEYDDVSKEKKEALREGKDKYILNLNRGEELCVYLSFNPDEYVVTDEVGNSIFEIKKLLCDYGWSENITNDVHKQNYEVDNGDMTIKLTITYDERMNSVTRVKCLNYDIVKKEDKRSYFYNYSERFSLPTNNVECEPHIDDEATIMLDSLDGAYVSQNDIFLLAYIISWVDVMPETVPFLYIDNICTYYSNYEPEYQKELQHDVILLY